MVQKHDNILSRFHLIPERYGRTDRRTDGEIAISISRVNILTRDKNDKILNVAVMFAKQENF